VVVLLINTHHSASDSGSGPSPSAGSATSSPARD
jgi:hypothetical protein